jgi:probable phosphoglycerate mutase
MELILIRHGKTPWNRERKVQGGSIDLELNDTGLRQTHQLALSLKDHEIRQIYSSTLNRAYKTAEVINQFHDVPIHRRNGLMEKDSI